MAGKEDNDRGGLPVPRSRFGMKGFVRDLQREMKHVTWPSQAESTRLTGVVLAVCVLIALLLTVLSYGFDALIRILGGR